MSRNKKRNRNNVAQEEVVSSVEETPVLSAAAPEEAVEVPEVAEEPVVAPQVVETIEPKVEEPEPPKPVELDSIVDEKVDPPPPKTKFVLERKGFGCHMYLREVDSTGKTSYTEDPDGAMFEKDKETAHRRFNSLVDGLKARGAIKANAVFEIVAI